MAKRAPKSKAKASRRISSKSAIQALRNDGVDVRRPWLGAWLPLLEKYSTPAELAAELGVTYQTLRRWGTGSSIPESSRKLIRMVAAQKNVASPI